MTRSKLGNTRGILSPKAGAEKFHLSRALPSANLCSFIEQYWVVHWDLRGQKPYTSETLPFPSIHLVIEDRQPEVYGVVTGKFTRRLQGRGRAFGVKFRPAGFYPFFRSPLSSLTDRTTTLHAVFGKEATNLRKLILGETDESQCVRYMEEFLTARRPKWDPFVEAVRDVVENVAKNPTITRVEQVASLLNISLRPLQRSFSKYVGISPKWVIQRYRLQEAAELLANSSETMTEIALRLGYFDQAHFIRDFRAVVGTTPRAYAEVNLDRSSR